MMFSENCSKLNLEVSKMRKRFEKRTARLGETVPKRFQDPIVTDPNGSYTGRPKDPDDRPIQDADDL